MSRKNPCARANILEKIVFLIIKMDIFRNYSSNLCNFFELNSPIFWENLHFFVYWRSFDPQKHSCARACIIFVYFYNAKDEMFQIGNRSKRIWLECQTFVLILLFYVAQNARFERIFFSRYSKFFHFFCSVTWDSQSWASSILRWIWPIRWLRSMPNIENIPQWSIEIKAIWFCDSEFWIN